MEKKRGRPPRRSADGRTLEEIVLATSLAGATTQEAWEAVERAIPGGTSRDYVARLRTEFRRAGKLRKCASAGDIRLVSHLCLRRVHVNH